MIAPSLIVGSPTIGTPMLVAMHPAKMRQAKLRFKQHRNNAKRRDVLFEMLFPNWIGVWWTSGHWHERGKRKGQFVMARYQDRGAYVEGNIQIITNAENVIEAFGGKPHTEEVRRRQSESCKARGEAAWRHAVNARIGTHHSAETRARMSASQIERQARERAEREVAP
jgi:hypothetical protein